MTSRGVWIPARRGNDGWASRVWRWGWGCSVVGFGFAFCLLGFGSAMEGPGLSLQGGGRPACFQPRVSVVTWQTSEESSPEGISTTSFTRPLGEVAGAFSQPSLG